MPQLLNQINVIFIFESELPHPAISNLAIEALISGVVVITDQSSFIETYRDIFTLDQNHVLVLSSTEASSSGDMITQWIRKRPHSKQIPYRLVSHQDYLSSTERIYETI